ncbi:MAG TPA: PilZ domain-containing protein [Vicinamibacterales bacterium]|jgi:hypothetical protein
MADWREDCRRAARYPLSLSVRYCCAGDDVWYDGTTIEMSHSGVRFVADGPRPGVATRIDFSVALTSFGPTEGSTALCSGRIVRVGDAGSGHRRVVAATIDEYHLSPSSAAVLTKASAPRHEGRLARQAR